MTSHRDYSLSALPPPPKPSSPSAATSLSCKTARGPEMYASSQGHAIVQHGAWLRHLQYQEPCQQVANLIIPCRFDSNSTTSGFTDSIMPPIAQMNPYSIFLSQGFQHNPRPENVLPSPETLELELELELTPIATENVSLKKRKIGAARTTPPQQKKQRHLQSTLHLQQQQTVLSHTGLKIQDGNYLFRKCERRKKSRERQHRIQRAFLRGIGVVPK